MKSPIRLIPHILVLLLLPFHASAESKVPIIGIKYGVTFSEPFPSFIKTTEGWVEFNSREHAPSQSIVWTLVDDGKAVGPLDSKTITPKVTEKLKAVAKRQLGQISSFIDPSERKSRLVAPSFIGSSLTKVKDPEAWSRATPPKEIISFLKKTYLTMFPFKLKCQKSGPDLNQKTYHWTDSQLTPDDVLVESRAFTSNRSWWLVGLKNRFGSKDRQREETSCFELNTYPIQPKYDRVIWFATDGKNVVSIEGERDSYFPLEAADFDNDGQSEWIFMYPDVDARKYILYSANFKKSVSSRGR